jgi:glycosyltransferase involved in cell wall biosynthesis
MQALYRTVKADGRGSMHSLGRGSVNVSLPGKDAPSVSVIIPVFNRQDTAIASIRSVLAQSFTDLELIVVDDGSSPPFVLPAELESDGRIRVLRQQENRGAGAARNAGANAARGQWIAWLDSDDEWHPHKLERQLDFVKANGIGPKRTAVASGFEYRFADGRREQRIPLPSDDPSMFFSGCWFCPGSTVLLGREAFGETGSYDQNMMRLEDVDWFARFALAGGELAVVPEPLAIIHLGGRPDFAKVRSAGDYLVSKYRSDPRVSRTVRRHLHAYLELEYAASLMKGRKHFIRGLGHLLRSWLLLPRVTLQVRKFWQ